MVIYFLRHASAGQHVADAAKDAARPLDDKGIQQCADVGRALAGAEVQVETIYSSPLKRALQTATYIARELGFRRPIETIDVLKPEANYAAFRRWLSETKKKEVMISGHNPGISEFLSKTLGGSTINLKKAAVAKVEVEDASGTLEWLITPKLAKAIQSGKR